MDFTYDHLFKLLIVGDSGVGKSAMLNRYVDDTFSDIQITTIGVDFKIKTQDINNKKIKLQIWDTAGQERFRNIVSSYYRGGQAVFIVYDVTDRESFDHLIFWMREIEKYGQRDPGPIVYIIGNKTDLQRKVSYTEAKTIADTWGVNYLETSAKTNFNINNVFHEISVELLERSKSNQSCKINKTHIGPSEPINKFSCCWIS